MEYSLTPVMGALIQLLFVLAAWQWLRTSHVARSLDPRPRHWWSFLPSALIVSTTTVLVLLLITVVLTGATATSDSLGRSSRIRTAIPGDMNGCGFAIYITTEKYRR